MALVGVGASRTEVGLRHNLDIKETGKRTTVRNDCRTKLMFYLHCFSSISKFDEVHPEWSKYTEYNTYKSWTLKEEEELLHICRDEITIFVAMAVGFIEVPDEILGDHSNRFFEVTNTDEVLLNHVQVHIDANSIYAANIGVGAKRELKFKVMMHRRSWVKEYYFTPLVDLTYKIEKEKEEIKEAERRRERERREREERRRREEEERRERERREKEERRERERRRIHNEEIIEKNRNCCCIVTERTKADYPNIVRFVVILYFIHAITLLFFI